MKPDLNANHHRTFNLRTLLFAFIYVSLTLLASQSLAKELQQGAMGSASLSASQASGYLNAITQHSDFECEEGDTVCEILSEICEDDFFCQLLIRICQQDPELCEEILKDYFGEECPPDETDCEDPPEECPPDEADCEEPPECDESEEECDLTPPPGELPVCDEESEQECEFRTGFENPNPLPDTTIMTIDKTAADQASRFLAQTTLGANYATITQVASIGEEVWLEDQFNQPVGTLFPHVDYLVKLGESYGETEQFFDIVGDPERFYMNAWWTQVMTSPDLLRQRVALALSEIFVISTNVEAIGISPYAISQYYDTLLNNSFGNFRDLLRDISLNPAMAIYLSHLNNRKADQTAGTFPDENYAREVMQLFSIGLFELNADGSKKQDASGNDIATYGQNEIREFAKIFTGLSIDHEEGFGFVPDGNGDFYYHARTMAPLKMYEAMHSTGEKRLLNGVVVPADQTGMQDIDAAIDNLFNHPNVGSFIGKQLIQRLVKSNPGPAYVARVTAAFNGETGSPRGDMKAVLRAIFLDPEARTAPANAGVRDGRLREPFIRLVRLMRSFNATSVDRNYVYLGFEINEMIKQFVLSAPSVFNFFQPDYVPNGELKDAGLVAPEFQITNASTIVQIKNLVDWWLEMGRFEDRVGALPGEVVTFEQELALASDVDALLDRLDTVMTYGTLSANSRAAIKSVLEAEPDSTLRVKKAVYLMAISPDFAIAL